MEPSYDIRLKLQQRKIARERTISSSSSDKENHIPAGVQLAPPRRLGRGRGFAFQQRKAQTLGDDSDGELLL